MSWYDDYAEHMINTEMYASEREIYLQKIMSKIKKHILPSVPLAGEVSSKGVLKEFEDYVSEISEDELDSFEKHNEQERNEYAKKESRLLKDMLKAVFGITLGITSLALAKALSAPFGKHTFQTFSKQLKSDVKESFVVPVRAAYSFGENAGDVKAVAEKRFEIVSKHALSDIRTSVTALQRNIQRNAVSNRLKYQYVSMLDDKTCLSCGGLSGNVYNSMEEAPILPLHNRCRCYYLPIIEPVENMTYEEWISSLPDSTVYKILGPARYALYKSGIKIKDFSDNGKTLTLKELFDSK